MHIGTILILAVSALLLDLLDVRTTAPENSSVRSRVETFSLALTSLL